MPDWDMNGDPTKSGIACLSARIRELEAELSTARAEIESKSDQIGKLYRVCNEKDDLQVQLNHARAEIEASRENHKSLEDMTRRARDAFSAASAENEKANAKGFLEGTHCMAKECNAIIKRKDAENEALRKKIAATDIRIEELEAQRDHARGEVSTLDYIRSSLATSIEQGKELGNVIARQANLVQVLRGEIALAREALGEAIVWTEHLCRYSILPDWIRKARAARAEINQSTKDNNP